MNTKPRPPIVCLCGSSKFPDEHILATMRETLLGKIVLPLGLYGHADFPKGAKFVTKEAEDILPVRQMLDRLQLQKIEMADEIFVVNPIRYFGPQTRIEIEYAQARGKRIRFLCSPAV